MKSSMSKKYIIKNAIDLANPMLGTKIINCSDEFFAPAKRIINPLPVIFKENGVTISGKKTKYPAEVVNACFKNEVEWSDTLRGRWLPELLEVHQSKQIIIQEYCGPDLLTYHMNNTLHKRIPDIVEQVTKMHEFFKQHNLNATLNTPYAGGFITRNYGIKQYGYHAVQIEVNKQLYMNERNYELSINLKKIQEIFSKLFNEFLNVQKLAAE